MKKDIVSLLPMPDTVSIGITRPDPENEHQIATIITKYTSEDPEKVILSEAFLVTTSAELAVIDDLQDPSRVYVHFTVSHDCSNEGCPALSSKIEFMVRRDGLSEFFQKLENQASFLWFCSTPTFEGKILIHRPTQRVVTRSVIERTLQ